jgi:hypothetical protein
VSTLNYFDRLGLPLKWATIVAAAVVLGRLLSFALGLTEGPGAYELLLSVIFGGIAGYVVGIVRRRSGTHH